MNRYELQNAIEKVDGYFLPCPSNQGEILSNSNGPRMSVYITYGYRSTISGHFRSSSLRLSRNYR